MEYKLILSGRVSKEAIEVAVKNWLRGVPVVLPPAHRPASAARGVPIKPGIFAGHPATTAHRAGGSSSRTTSIAPPIASPFSSHQLMTRGEITLTPQIRLVQLSQMGKGQVHTFVLNGRELLIIRQTGLHHQWVQLQHPWEGTISHQARQAVQPADSPANHSQWERLKMAMASGIRQLPGHVVASVQQLIDNILTWEGMLLMVAVTALFVLGGEVALLLMGAVAVYDLLMNVLPLLVEFYHKASAARTQPEIDEAGKLFARALLRGGLDVIDILFAAGAYRRLMVLGGGRLTFRAVIAYLSERATLLMARLRQGAGKIQQLMREARETAASKKNQPAPQATTAPSPSGKLVAGTPAHKAQRWADYQAKGGKWDYARWSKQYDTNMHNASHGLGREAEYRDAMGGVSETVKTPLTNRQIDVSIPDKDYMGQIKTGKMALTKQAKIDIAKDAILVKQGKDVEYILEKGASKPFLDALKKAGVKYKIGSQIP